jgi:hypothetical protein
MASEDNLLVLNFRQGDGRTAVYKKMIGIRTVYQQSIYEISFKVKDGFSHPSLRRSRALTRNKVINQTER